MLKSFAVEATSRALPCADVDASAFEAFFAASALFLLFGVVYLYEALLSIDPEATDFHPLS